MAHKQVPTPRAYRVNEVVSMLSISRRTVYRMIGSGTLRATKVGSITLIPVADIDAVLSGGQ